MQALLDKGSREIQHQLNRSSHSNLGRAWLITQIAPLSTTFVDVGANVGNWSALFLKSAPSSVKGILFEPSSHTLKVLRTNLEHLNNLEIVEQALGDSEGIVTFFDELGMGESSSVIKKASLTNAVKTVVSVTTLDIVIPFGI